MPAAEELVRTMPHWNSQWLLSEKAAESLWERAATHILAHEDAGDMKPTQKAIWEELHDESPDLYPSGRPQALDGWWRDPDWQQYLALRRQEHYIRSMPARLEIKRYHSQLLQTAGSELVQRLHADASAVSTRELVNIVKMSTAAIGALEGDIKIASGEESGNPVSIQIFQFLDNLPPERRQIVAAAAAKRQVAARFDTIPAKASLVLDGS